MKIDAQNWYQLELNLLQKQASKIADEYYTWLKLSGNLIQLWVRVRRVNGTLQIEWTIPTWKHRIRDGRRKAAYLPKGKTHRYPSARLLKHVPEEHHAEILEFERRFSKIRLSAKLLADAKRALEKYQKHTKDIKSDPYCVASMSGKEFLEKKH